MTVKGYTPKYFNFSEYDCRCLCGLSGKSMNISFLRKMDLLRERCGFPLIIASGIRCEKHNKAVGGKPSSFHLLKKDGAEASDVKVYRQQARIVIKNAIDLNFGGIGINQKGDISSRFIHLDMREEEVIFSY
jgi:zinc D-Ala-D-Ala carboxypeptidase